MRITNGMILNNYVNNLHNNLEKMDKFQTQIATNKRITKLSDDPIGVISSMQCRVKLYKIEQYKKNIDTAQTWVQQTESSVLQMNEVIKTAYEATVHIANDYMTGSDKSAAAELIGQLRDDIKMVGNSKSGDKYIFGGYNVITPPFTLNATGDILYNGLDLNDDTNSALITENSQVIEYEIGYNMNTEISIPGTRLMNMGEDNIYSVLDDLYNVLKSNGSAAQIGEYIDKIQNCQGHMMAIEADLGGRTNRLQLVTNRYEDDFINYTELKSKVEDVDLAEVSMKYKMSEAVYLAALRIGSDIIQPSLVDFLN